MNAKKTDLKELEGWYEKSGNQLHKTGDGTMKKMSVLLVTLQLLKLNQ